ncbi:hypothetical protein M2128_001479 [Polynucleobacter sphagniphilus]|jgi:hypothetical protein|uniref:Uncharacterized protein n=1 Tax=Polynucleobacter sphagniphilus TaxID=1743169 RepID=A0AA43S5U6_9BURK|nr:hypothetical protein [Polynucleobacter sphagniphilus]MDH6155393.1 hypothetical protein [Polynucleobacter sphagniphilus]MDH6240793.1 hypothetical protein [Polynucleobacter sphagniphilus]MDH6249711.1 hypothetical protein [Polynucleobacter sphagniphilus]MDH6300467.1 hypothetical protein [Polynucleobacter sphagniphilus]
MKTIITVIRDLKDAWIEAKAWQEKHADFGLHWD